jgi:hypothetical protein
MIIQMTDRHPRIRAQALFDGWSQDADVDFDAFSAVQQQKLYLLGPTERMHILSQVDSAIGEPDGTNLRA